MRDLLPALTGWFGEKKAFAVALVTAVEGSSPQRPGAMFVRGPDGEALGGGCLDAQVEERRRDEQERRGEKRKAADPDERRLGGPSAEEEGAERERGGRECAPGPADAFARFAHGR